MDCCPKVHFTTVLQPRPCSLLVVYFPLNFRIVFLQIARSSIRLVRNAVADMGKVPYLVKIYPFSRLKAFWKYYFELFSVKKFKVRKYSSGSSRPVLSLLGSCIKN